MFTSLANVKGVTSTSAVFLHLVANEFDITLMKDRKILITVVVYYIEINHEVNKLKAEEKFIEQIM